MGFFDQIPFLSQLESLARVTFGDPEGALKCQENFLATCPVISQVGSATYAALGNTDKALQLQLQFADAMENLVASTPVVGYVGAGISELCNDRERAAKYLTSCNKSTAILAVGAATIATGGVAGTVLAAGAGVAAGIGMDEANNEIRVGMTGTRSDQGFVTAVKNISHDRDDGKSIGEACFGASLGLVGDAAGGVGGRGLARKVHIEYKKNSAVKKSVAADQSSAACDKKTVRKNLDDSVASARENKEFLADARAAQGKGPVQCDMTGKAGVKGSGMSESARKARSMVALVPWSRT